MPGTYVIDIRSTFIRCVLINGGAKEKYGQPGVQEVNAQGVPKWFAEAAVTFAPQGGMGSVSELITITITSAANPFDTLATSEVIFEGLRVGNSPPERNDKGGIKGGKLWFTATGIRPALADARSKDSAA